MNETGFRGTFTTAQTKQLLAPIRPNRVLRDGKGNSHVSQQDVTAHLIRVLGFGNFATELLDLALLFETPRAENAREPWKRRWDVAYRATMRLTIFDHKHNPITTYEDASVGDAQNLVRQEAHDLAMKSAISLAKKRCCINLGDQFGLSLYNKGQMEALVRGTLVLPADYEKPEEESQDVQEGVPQQESMGHDEIEKESGAATGTEEQEAMLARSLGAETVEVIQHENPATEVEGHPEDAVPEEQQVPMITQPQHAKIGALLREQGITQRATAINRVAGIIGRDIESRNDLTRDEAGKVIETLEGVTPSE